MPKTRQKQTAEPAKASESNGDSELIKASDFESSRLEIKITNTTTNTKSKKDAGIELVELGDLALLLEVPPRTCSSGHNLLLEIVRTEPAGKPVTFTATCKVDEVESVSPDADRIAVTLVQLDEKQWEKFCEGFGSRQAEIEEFFRAAKGY